jgi:hypothetical protein
MGIFTYSDVSALIEKVVTGKVDKRPGREEGFRQSLGI